MIPGWSMCSNSRLAALRGAGARWRGRVKTGGDRFIRRLVVAGKINGGSITNYIQKSIKELVRKNKLDSWNDVIEKANKDFHENRKEFWAFVGRTSKVSRKGIASLRSTSGSCETSTKGKLEVLCEHYERLGTALLDDQFDDIWKEHIEKKVTDSEMSSL